MLDLFAAVGRICMSVIFILEGYGKLTAIEATANYIGNKVPAIPQLEEALGMQSPTIYAYAAGGVELGCGILIILSLFTRLAAFGLLVFTALTILYFHNFWDLEGAQAATQKIHALKNLAIMGGLLMIMAHGPGGWSIRGNRVPAQTG
jgi:putative oxidoreductase